MKEKTSAIINKVIKKEAREEALKVMAMAEKKDLDDFFTHYEEESFNVVCMVIDKVKIDNRVRVFMCSWQYMNT